MTPPTTTPGPPLFTLTRFNPRRAARGAEAAEVEVTWSNGHRELLWMSEEDIAENIKIHGNQAGLTAANDAYAARTNQ